MPGLYTKEQLEKVFMGWGLNEHAPARGKKVVVAFPPSSDFKSATVKIAETKSTYGKTLYSIKFDRTRYAKEDTTMK